MESQRGGNPNLTLRKNAKLNLEEYLYLTGCQELIPLTLNHLKQIINIHGFRNISKLPKAVVMDAGKTIDLMDPGRSTLENSEVSPQAILTLEEAISDLATLNWQECCVTSLETLPFNTRQNNDDAPVEHKKNLKRGRQFRGEGVAAVDALVVHRKNRKRDQKFREEGVAADDSAVGGGGMFGCLDNVASCSSSFGDDGGGE